MGYRIDYSPLPPKRSIFLKNRKRYISLLFFALFLTVVDHFWLDGAQILDEAARLLISDADREAVEAFVMNIENGMTVTQSLREVFRQVLHHAGVL